MTWMMLGWAVAAEPDARTASEPRLAHAEDRDEAVDKVLPIGVDPDHRRIRRVLGPARRLTSADLSTTGSALPSVDDTAAATMVETLATTLQAAEGCRVDLPSPMFAMLEAVRMQDHAVFVVVPGARKRRPTAWSLGEHDLVRVSCRADDEASDPSE